MKLAFKAGDFDESDKPFEAKCGACGLRHNIQWPVDATCLPAALAAGSEPTREQIALAIMQAYAPSYTDYGGTIPASDLRAADAVLALYAKEHP